jgi:hypothetical protein
MDPRADREAHVYPPGVTPTVRAVLSVAIVSMASLPLACGTSSAPQINQPCSATTPCNSGLACGYPINAGCVTTGVCVPDAPQHGSATCQGGTAACGCDGAIVGYGCGFYPGYAPAPIDSKVSFSQCSPANGGPTDGGGLTTSPDAAADGGPTTSPDE